MPFSKAFDYASGVTAKRFTNPLWRLFEIFTGKRFRAAVAEVKSFGQSVVKSTIEKRHPTAPPLPEREKAPLSSNLINSLLDHISSPDVVADAAMNFLSAGRDTTAQSLTWTLYSLFRNPDVHTSLLSALHEAFPDHKRADSLPVDFSSLTAPHAFPLANAIFAETLRLNPAVPFELKESTAASTLPDGTYLPKGAVVIWIPYALARSPSIWGDDASEFKPERWIDRQGDGALHLVTRSAFENPVFNAGPRMCIGKKLAEVLAIRVLCEIVWLWDLKEVQGKGEVNGQRVLGESLTAPMEGGLPVKVRRARTGSVDNQPG